MSVHQQEEETALKAEALYSVQSHQLAAVLVEVVIKARLTQAAPAAAARLPLAVVIQVAQVTKEDTHLQKVVMVALVFTREQAVVAAHQQLGLMELLQAAARAAMEPAARSVVLLSLTQAAAVVVVESAEERVKQVA